MTLQFTKAAWDHPPTAVGYKRLVRRRAVGLLSLVLPLAFTLACLWFDFMRQGALLFIMSTIGFITWVPWAAIAYWRRHRVAAVLQAYPWCELPCLHPARATGSPATIAIPFREDFSPTYRIIPFPIALAERENDHPDRIWFAGDPRFGGVVSPVGGHYPVRVVPDKVPAEGWSGGDDGLALRVGLVRRSGKGTRT
ncbi:hypothetical protein [Streptomyces sp. NPDC058701]|uniref:hypothetical protein n=1 Tax=Streptomyces sp. NPDC058701 TaxID=3346608 RepID=UPI003655196D